MFLKLSDKKRWMPKKQHLPSLSILRSVQSRDDMVNEHWYTTPGLTNRWTTGSALASVILSFGAPTRILIQQKQTLQKSEADAFYIRFPCIFHMCQLKFLHHNLSAIIVPKLRFGWIKRSSITISPL